MINRNYGLIDPLGDNIFERIFGRNNSLFSLTETMKTDIEETPEAYVLKVDIPGGKKDNIEISYEDEMLTIKVEEKYGKEDKKYLLKERGYSCSTRSFHVPNVNEKALEASFNEGVLEIKAPKNTEKKEPKRITIK